MIGCKRYYKSDEMIGSGDYVFRRYSANPLVNNTDDRFIQYVNGTLEEILPEDFGNITEIPESTMFNIIDDKLGNVPLKVVMPDTVTTIGEHAFNNMFIKEVVFSANISIIKQNVMLNSQENAIADFSKAKSIPTRYKADNDADYGQFGDDVTIIKVPSNLYAAWSSREDWADISSKLVSV